MTMQGAYQAKNFMNEYLMNDMPDRLVNYRNAWNLDDENLPDPLKYLVYEPVALDTWPTVITVVISMNGITRADYTPTLDPLYFVEYSMRTYIWVKDDDSDQCTAKRDRLTTVVRSAILDDPCLEQHADSNYLQVEVDEGTLREEYSDLTFIKGERVMAGSYLAYTMRITEIGRLDGAPENKTKIGEVDEIRTEFNLLSPLIDNP